MEMFPEKSSILHPGVVNIVGENHAESDERRDLEIEFVRAMLGNGAGYWTETDFPTEQWQPPSMSRKPRERTGKKDAPGADLMEYRGAQAAAIIVGAFEQLCDAARKVGARTDPRAGAAVTAFAEVNLSTFIDLMERNQDSFEVTDPDSVPESGREQFAKVKTVVDLSFDGIRSLLQKFVRLLRKSDSVEEQLAAIRLLGDGHDLASGLLKQLSAVVGVSGKGGAEKVEQEIQDERSRSMALGAVLSDKFGVYKVGTQHIKDLAEIKVDSSRVNIVTREDFNRALETWKKAAKRQQRREWVKQLNEELDQT